MNKHKELAYSCAALLFAIIVSAAIAAFFRRGDPLHAATSPSASVVTILTSNPPAAARPTATCVVQTPYGTIPGNAPATADNPAGGGRWGDENDADEQASFQAVYGSTWRQHWQAEHNAAGVC